MTKRSKVPADTVPADDGFGVAVPCVDNHGNAGFIVHEVVAWRIDGHSDSGEIIPITDPDLAFEDEVVWPGDLYAVQHPDGSFRFPDGERCASEAELLESFRKRLA